MGITNKDILKTVAIDVPNMKEQLESNIQEVNNLKTNKADVSYVDTRVASISSGTPLFASSTSGMTDTTKNYVNTADGYLYTYNGITFVKTTVLYQSTGINDASISEKKLSFLTISAQKGDNLFNCSDFEYKKSLSSTGGLETNAVCSVTHFIQVVPNKQYYKKNLLAGCWYDSNKTFISNITSLIAPSNAMYARFNFGVDVEKTCILSENVITGYEKYTKLDKNTVTSEMVIDNSITSNKIKNNEIGYEKLKIETLEKSKSCFLKVPYLQSEKTNLYNFFQVALYDVNFSLFGNYEGVYVSKISGVRIELKDRYNNIIGESNLSYYELNKTVTLKYDNQNIKGEMLIEWDNYLRLFNKEFDMVNTDISKYKLNVKNIKTVTTSSQQEYPPIYNNDYDVNMFIAYGQSWSIGFEARAISINQNYNNIMFNGGIKAQCVNQDLSISCASFIPAIEQTSENGTPESSGWGFPGETPSLGQSDMVNFLLKSENNIDSSNYKMLLSAPGEGSKSLKDLSKGSIYYNRLIEQVQRAYNICQSQGKTFNVPAISWSQDGAGAGHNTLTDYVDLLEKLRTDLETDIKAITKQKNNLKLITWQRFGYGDDIKIVNRYVEASEKYENIICSAPSYFLDTVTPQSLHFNSKCQRILGNYFGIAYKRTLLDNVKWQPLKPIKFIPQGKILIVQFHVPAPPLQFDTTWVTLNENYGFNLYDVNGVEKKISSVEIVGTDKVKIVIESGNIEDTDVLKYGNKGTQWSRVTGQRGNLTDSQDLVDNGFELKNYCVMFSKAINQQ